MFQDAHIDLSFFFYISASYSNEDCRIQRETSKTAMYLSHKAFIKGCNE
jgi:hypothetical protein